MTDIVSKKKRSEMMAGIRGKNTKPEKLVFSYLRKEKIYFQKHYSKVPGSPDIALPKKKIAIFIDGDFWHAKDYPKCLKRLSLCWRKKITDNYLRDKKSRAMLRRRGWRVQRIWESELRSKQVVTLIKCRDFILH